MNAKVHSKFKQIDAICDAIGLFFNRHHHPEVSKYDLELCKLATLARATLSKFHDANETETLLALRVKVIASERIPTRH